MKHLKLFEDIYDHDKLNDVKLGEYVIVIRAYRNSDYIKNGDRCKVVSLKNTDNTFFVGQYVIIENEDGIREEYRKNRIISELEYNANKYNL